MNRREMLLAGGVAGAAAGSASGAMAAAEPAAGAIADDLARYSGFGPKLTGGSGDTATGAWMEGRLRALGFTTHRQPFEAPFLTVRRAVLEVGGATLPLRPQAPWRTTPETGVSGPLRAWPGAGTGPPDVRGAVAVVTLPYRRWAAFGVREVEGPVRGALAAGAAAVLIVTTGPTGKAIALNVDIAAPPFAAPVAVLAPEDAARVADALRAGATGRVTVTGEQGVRPAFNLAGRLDRGAGRWLVISTPRSGWDLCAGERGPGVAVWLDMARWAARTLTGFDVLMTSASGHERGYHGAKLFLKSGAPPPPERTAFWLHLGASVSARDWHELGTRLAPLPSVDPQRVLAAERGLLPLARDAFRGLPGLEAPYGTDQMADGELGDIVGAGYRRCAGVFGAHRFFHTDDDDMRCIAPGTTEAAAGAFRAFTAAVLRGTPAQPGA